MRLRAITAALWYGVLPWQVYEAECHYEPMGYWRHLLLNLRVVGTWMLRLETDEDRLFEQTLNPRLPWVPKPHEAWPIVEHEPEDEPEVPPDLQRAA